MNTIDKIRGVFVLKFKIEPEFIIRAPGRINLLGEHTDYNSGFVLPAAIDKAIYFCVSKREDTQFSVEAIDLGESFIQKDINNLIINEAQPWSKHIIGVLLEIQKLGKSFSSGLNVVFGGDIPNGAGLSSSAAVEAGIGFAVNEVFDLNLTTLQLAQIAQQTEHNYVGVQCGIMDMYASLFSKEGHVIRLDCSDLTHEYLPLDQSEYQFVLVNCGVKHNLAESAYNKRRMECHEAVLALNGAFGNISSLRDASLNQLNSLTLNADVYNRARYIIEENTRLINAGEILKSGDMVQFGLLMNATHKGLSELYEVSCKELDYLQSEALKINGVVGSRMMGGGFGGCTLNLISRDSVSNFVEQIKNLYNNEFSIMPETYSVNIKKGVNRVI